MKNEGAGGKRLKGKRGILHKNGLKWLKIAFYWAINFHTDEKYRSEPWANGGDVEQNNEKDFFNVFQLTFSQFFPMKKVGKGRKLRPSQAGYRISSGQAGYQAGYQGIFFL